MHADGYGHEAVGDGLGWSAGARGLRRALELGFHACANVGTVCAFNASTKVKASVTVLGLSANLAAGASGQRDVENLNGYERFPSIYRRGKLALRVTATQFLAM